MDTYEKKFLLANGLTGTNTDASALKNYRFTVSSLPAATLPGNQPLTWTLGGKISFYQAGPAIYLNVTSGGYPNYAPKGLGKSICDPNIQPYDKTCYALLFYPPTIPILPTPPNTGPNKVDGIYYYAVGSNDGGQTITLEILLSDYQRIPSVNKVKDVSDLTAYRFKGSKDVNIEWMLNGTTGPTQYTTTIGLGVTSGPDERADLRPGGYTLTFYPRIQNF